MQGMRATCCASPERSEEEALAYSRASFSSISTSLPEAFELLPEPVLVLDQHRQIVFGNAAAARLLQCNPTEMLGQRVGEALGCTRLPSNPSGCGTGEGCRNCGALLAILNAQTGQESERECRILRHGPSGWEALEWRVTCRPLRWADHDFLVLAVRDISAEKRRQVLERIFFHDLLNLAGGIEGLVTLVKEEVVPLEEVKEDLAVSATSLIQEIRSQQMLLAAEQAQLALTLSPLHALEVLEECRSSFRGHLSARNREIIILPQSRDFTLTSDRAILHRVLGNLVKNGLEAVPEGGQVTLSCEPTALGGAFHCHNALCMSEEVCQQIFQRSFSTKGQGRGIGTYSVKLLTDKYLGGQISFVSTPAAGTTFTVSLPVSPANPPAARPQTYLTA